MTPTTTPEKQYAIVSPPGPKTQAERELSFAVQMALLRQMVASDLGDAAGVACSFLLHAIDRDPQLVRRLLQTPIEKVGRPGTTILGLLNRVAT